MKIFSINDNIVISILYFVIPSSRWPPAVVSSGVSVGGLPRSQSSFSMVRVLSERTVYVMVLFILLLLCPLLQ